MADEIDDNAGDWLGDDGDTPDTPETASQTAADASEDAAENDDSTDDPDDAQEANQAAKKGVRQKLKDAEAANERLTAAVTRAKDALIDAALDRAGVQPDQRQALLRVIGSEELNDCLDDDGLPDPELLLATVEVARSELGLPRRPRPTATVGRGRSGGDDPKPTSFADVLRDHVKTAMQR